MVEKHNFSGKKTHVDPYGSYGLPMPIRMNHMDQHSVWYIRITIRMVHTDQQSVCFFLIFLKIENKKLEIIF